MVSSFYCFNIQANNCSVGMNAMYLYIIYVFVRSMGVYAKTQNNHTDL